MSRIDNQSEIIIYYIFEYSVGNNNNLFFLFLCRLLGLFHSKYKFCYDKSWLSLLETRYLGIPSGTSRKTAAVYVASRRYSREQYKKKIKS